MYKSEVTKNEVTLTELKKAINDGNYKFVVDIDCRYTLDWASNYNDKGTTISAYPIYCYVVNMLYIHDNIPIAYYKWRTGLEILCAGTMESRKTFILELIGGNLVNIYKEMKAIDDIPYTHLLSERKQEVEQSLREEINRLQKGAERFECCRNDKGEIYLASDCFCDLTKDKISLDDWVKIFLEDCLSQKEVENE